MTQDTVVITQSAREAAKAFDPLLWSEHPNGEDFIALTEAIAAAEQRGFKRCQDAAVKAAEDRAARSNQYFAAGLGGDEGKDRNAARYRTANDIADAIRALSIKEADNG
jgi:hypothetical protein